MGLEFYVNLNRKIRADKTRRQLVMLLNELLTWLIVLIYVIGLIRSFVHGGIRPLFMLILDPFATFVIARLLRMVLKEPRPYRCAPVRPLIRRKKNSYSFPSCHVASAFVIGTCMLALSMTVTGICVLLAGVLLAAFRVLCGAHFIKDVAAGACLGILGGLVPFIIL